MQIAAQTKLLALNPSALRAQGELIERKVFRSLVDAALDLVLLSRHPSLVVTRPSTTTLPWGQSALSFTKMA
jgi:hypothetical protein